jgi:hypothetical protein
VRGEEITLIMYCSIPLAVVGARLLLAGSREETSTGELQAENSPHIDIYEMVAMEEGHHRGYHRRTLWWRRKKGHLFGVHLTMTLGFKLHWEAVGQRWCPSQKGSGVEVVCIECLERWSQVPEHVELMAFEY